MAEPICLIAGKEIENVKDDFKKAQRVEQYRLSSRAIYIPAGFKWNYIPFSEIKTADESIRVISGGHCVPVREKRPEIDIDTQTGLFHVQLEKAENMQKIMSTYAEWRKQNESHVG